MSSRLSEDSVVKSLDSGWQALTWRGMETSNNSSLGHLNFSNLLDAKDPLTAVQSVPRRDMYFALSVHGSEDALEILPFLSSDQFLCIIDNEGWQDDRLSIHKTIQWLDLYRHIGPEHLYKRFRELDEEYQVALLNPYIEMIDSEDYERLTSEIQDSFQPMPCQTLWWRVKQGDEKITQFVESLINASIGEDTAYTYSLLAMSAMNPPGEQEQLIKQFRDARLEEDGFVTPAESASFFVPQDCRALAEKWHRNPKLSESIKLSITSSDGLFLDDVLSNVTKTARVDSESIDYVKRNMAFLANAMSTACHVSPDDIRGLSNLLRQTKSLTSFGLEALSQGDLTLAEEILFTDFPKSLFMFALSAVEAIRLEVLSYIKANHPETGRKLESLLNSRKFGGILWLLDKELLSSMEWQSVETLKGLFNRFPMVKEEFTTIDGVSRAKFRPLATVTDYSTLLNDVRSILTVHNKNEVIH